MEYLRETVIRDIIDILDGVKDKDYVKMVDRFANSKYSSSVAKQSKDLIMTFPVLCSNTLEPRTATMVSKAIERKCVTMLHLLFSACCISDAKDAQEFINQYHKNISMQNMSVDDMIKLTAELGDEIGADWGIQMNQAIKGIKESMQSLYNDTEFVDSVNESSIQDFKVLNRYGQDMIIRRNTSVNEAASDDLRNVSSAMKNLADTEKAEVEMFQKRLLDNDAKKCNELVPSLLVIRFTSGKFEVDGKFVTTQAVVGVKARLIPVDSFEIVDKIFVKNNDKNTLLKLIRCTTRELSFFKDFLFAIDKAKVDALSQSRKGSTNPIWKVLERRSIKSKIRKSIRSQNDAMAITSLVLTQEEVNYLKKNHNINVENVNVARQIMEAYNLLSLEIVDESIEVVKFFFDGDDFFETLSFNNLERESGDGMYKKVINLMSKMSR